MFVLVSGCSGERSHRVLAHKVALVRSEKSASADAFVDDRVTLGAQPVDNPPSDAVHSGPGGAAGFAAPEPRPTARANAAGAGANTSTPESAPDADSGVDERANQFSDASVVAADASLADASAFDASAQSVGLEVGSGGQGSRDAGASSDDDAGDANSLPASSTEAQGVWASAWSRALLSTTGAPRAQPAQFDDQTLRLIVWPTLGGSRVRVKLSNVYATTSLRVGAAHVARHQSDGTIVGDSDRVLTFNGMPSVTITAGAQAWSDPVALDVTAHADLAISVYLPDTFTPQAFHTIGLRTSYLSSSGDHTASITMPAPTAGAHTTTMIFFAAEVQVQASAGRPAQIVALGDSLTDGNCSDIDANGAWPDLLSKRLTSLPDGTPVGIINAGISSNRLAASDAVGVRGIERLAQLLELPGVRWLVLLEGVNDISYEHIAAADLIAAYERAIAMAHAAQIKILGVPLLPIAHSVKDTPDNQATRTEVNAWIRGEGAYDAVLDFEPVLGDPDDPGSMRSDLTCDHVHPNQKGYEAMANAIDLSQFR